MAQGFADVDGAKADAAEIVKSIPFKEVTASSWVLRISPHITIGFLVLGALGSQRISPNKKEGRNPLFSFNPDMFLFLNDDLLAQNSCLIDN